AAQSEPSLPSAPVTTGAALATRPMTRVSLPADALGTIVPRAGETISSVDQIGDLNGDSKPDLGVVARSADGSGSTGYVVFAGNAADVDLGRLANQGRGFEIPGAMSIAAAGDVNGNGHPDLAVIGATASGAVAAFVLFDPAAAGQIDLQNLGAAGREIDMPTANEAPDGPQDGIANYVIRAAGDVNHDSVDDVIVGDPFADGAAGRAWVVFGSPDQVPTVALDALAPSEGFSITGSGTGSLGESVAAVGDVNGDGIDDVAVGAPYRTAGIAQLGSGVVDVVYGSDKPTNVDDPQLNGARGFQIANPAQTGQLGAAIAPLGDVNGDSVPDVLVTAPGMSPNGRTQAGAAYVVFGPGKPISGLSLDKLGSHGYEIQGPSPAKHGPGSILSGLGSSAAPAGDVNGDSVPDIVLGSPGAAAPGAVAYVVFGGPDHSTLDLADPGGRARAIDGPTASPPAPLAVTGAFDMDGDGRPDVLVAPAGAAAGPTAAYAVSGAP
ncbi:MAG: hypothetical protein QOE06_3128, partial [Thermoleophilaceae bacterium]|nr:hypothetical protein [Thermoleophilaceae bacterium]